MFVIVLFGVGEGLRLVVVAFIACYNGYSFLHAGFGLFVVLIGRSYTGCRVLDIAITKLRRLTTQITVGNHEHVFP